jgi:hypothetical protein
VSEQVQSLDQELAQQRHVAEADRRRAMGGAEGGRVEEHEAGEPLGGRHGRPQANGPTPIVSQERDLPQVQPLNQLPQVGHPLGQPIGV